MSVNFKRIQKITVCPSEIAAGTIGTANGSIVLAETFHEKFCPDIPLVYAPVNNVIQKEMHDMPAKYMEQVAFNLASTYHILKDNPKNDFHLNVTGDHSNAIATISAFADNHAPEHVGVIWVDAHADLHSPYTTPSGNMHGMPLAALLGINNKEFEKHQLSFLEADWWDKFKDIGLSGSYPKILPQHLVIIGMRDTEYQEDMLMEKLGIRYVKPDEINRIGMQNVVAQSIDYLASCAAIYCSFDIDSMDAQLVPGTGTPVSQGLNLQQAKEAVQLLFNHPKVTSFGLTEYNADIDIDQITLKNVISLFE